MHAPNSPPHAALNPESAVSSLGHLLQLGSVDENELYAAMDWLLARQHAIEQRLAKRHLNDNTLMLYDLTSSYFEGHSCPLARRGHSRDGKRGSLQIVFGLLCTADGCPIAVEVFEGSTGDLVGEFRNGGREWRPKKLNYRAAAEPKRRAPAG